jgi:hypothetical protein
VIPTRTRTALRLPAALLLAVMLSACGEAYVQDPWTTNAAQWKRSHFATQSPDETLDMRAALTQRDR